ncbi:hypothetical protein [Streptomyces sp. NPDC051162]
MSAQMSAWLVEVLGEDPGVVGPAAAAGDFEGVGAAGAGGRRRG